MSNSSDWIGAFINAEWEATQAKFTEKDNFAFINRVKALVKQVEGDGQWLDARKDRTMFPPPTFWDTAEEKLGKRRKRTLYAVTQQPHPSIDGLASGWVSSNNTQLDEGIYQRIHTGLVGGIRTVVGVDTVCPGCGGTNASCGECGGAGFVARIGVDARDAGEPTSVETFAEPPDERSESLLGGLGG